MTGIEFVYLMICVGAFLVFAITLAYSTWSWEQSYAEAARASGHQDADRASHVNPQTKLAA
jgi:hypothetical protein